MSTLPRSLGLLLAASCCLSPLQAAQAKVFQTVDKTFTASASPIDIAVSADGNLTFLLAPNGKVTIVNKDGGKEEITVDGDFDHIATAATGDKIWLSSQKTKQVKGIFVDTLKQLSADGSPFLGEEKAPVVLTTFSDFQCPHCAKQGELFQKLLEKNPTTIKIVYKYNPLPNHQFAGAAAIAAYAAHQQGKFWQYHDLVYANLNDLTIEKLTEFAEKLGLNMPQFQQQMNSQEAKDKVIKDLQEGREAGVSGTPVLFCNGRLVRDRTEENIQKMIDEIVKKK